jgi:hypothetical protein
MCDHPVPGTVQVLGKLYLHNKHVYTGMYTAWCTITTNFKACHRYFFSCFFFFFYFLILQKPAVLYYVHV